MKNADYYMGLEYEIVVKPLQKEDGGGWFAYYKDIKGVMGDGETPQEAIEEAQRAFRAYLEVALKHGDKIPLPLQSQSKVVRLNITIQEDELQKIDRYAKAHGMSRSGFLQAASRAYMEGGSIL